MLAGWARAAPLQIIFLSYPKLYIHCSDIGAHRTAAITLQKGSSVPEGGTANQVAAKCGPGNKSLWSGPITPGSLQGICVNVTNPCKNVPTRMLPVGALIIPGG